MTFWASCLSAVVLAMSTHVPTAVAQVRTTPAVELRQQLLDGLKPADDIAPHSRRIRQHLQSLNARRATRETQAAGLRSAMTEVSHLQSKLGALREGFRQVELRTGEKGGVEAVNALHDALEGFRGKLEEAVGRDDSGKLDIQDLMGTFNQAETLTSSVLRKHTDARKAIAAKVR